MISLLIYGCSQKEAALVKELCREIIAYNSDEKLEVSMELEEDKTPDIAVVNICGKGGIEHVHKVRSLYPKVEIMLISDVTVSPMQYLTPVIHPLSLVISPYKESELMKTLQDFVVMMFDVDDGALWVDTYNGKTKLPYANILYIEAKNKMINIRLESMEHSVYGTLEQYAEKLPSYFKRCHRAVIVNTKFVQKIRFSENYIMLKNGEMVPLSRSCKQNFKEMVKQ